MAKNKTFNKCIITEEDIVFTIIFERNCGYSTIGKNAKQTKAEMVRYSKSNFVGIKCRKGHRPTITEWAPITKYGDGYAHIKYIFQCGMQGIRTFLRNSNLEYDDEILGIIDSDGHKIAGGYSSGIRVDHCQGYEMEYFKRFGRVGADMYKKQNSSCEFAYVGVEIPCDRLEEAIVSAFKKPLEKIKDIKTLNNIQHNFDQLKLAYKIALEWVRGVSENCYKFNEPIPAFSVDFREQYLFA